MNSLDLVMGVTHWPQTSDRVQYLDTTLTHLKRYLEIYPDAGNAEAVEMQLTQVESLLAAQTPSAGQSAQRQ